MAKPKAAASASAPKAESSALDVYGELIPYADPNWYQSVSFFVCHNLSPRDLTQRFSITRHTITRPTPLSATKSDNG